MNAGNGREPTDSDPETKRHLVLIGPRGAGKTSVARIVAARLGRPPRDTDESIQLSGVDTIAEIFKRAGEPAFRLRERDALLGALQPPPAVVSVGGGAVLLAQNRAAIRAAGACVWLTARPDVLVDRVAGDPFTADQRPPLTLHSPSAEMTQLLNQRGPIYAELAQLRIDTSDLTLEQVADRVLDWLQTMERRP
ncbi:MAG: shikimate kinase [Phycisphaerae bacterium]